jgi:hypothetical protein
MDIEGCWHLPPHGAEYIEALEYFRGAFCITAHALVHCYSDYIGQDFYNAGQKREVVQAADFLIKEAQSRSNIAGVGETENAQISR